MLQKQEYTLVLDSEGNKLAPTKVQKAWFLIRKKRAKLIQKYPMVIQLTKKVDIIKDDTTIECGIDDGSKYVGIALVQKCKTKNKVFFKGTIELRQDVKKKMDIRREYRRYRRSHKHYRPARFNNRVSMIKKGLPPPSIKQKKDSIIRVVNSLNKFVNIDNIHLEDVKIDIREMVEGKKLYGNEYNVSNKENGNLRKATLIRDNYTCQECGKKNNLEVHHIVPRSKNGSNSIYNTITLCEDCHQKTEGNELLFVDKYLKQIGSDLLKGLNYAQHVMQGKKYLRTELKKIANLDITNGLTTSERRKMWGIEKTHSNDAICIAGLNPNNIEITEYTIVPQRRKSKAKSKGLNGFKHRDIVIYHHTNNIDYLGNISAIYTDGTNTLNVKTKDEHFKRVSCKRCKLFYRFDKIWWLQDKFIQFCIF